MTTKKKEDEASEPVKPAEEPQAAPKETNALEAIIASQGQQIAELMKAINQGGLPQAFDPSKSQFERERIAAHKAIKKSRQRTPEMDADPNLVWVGTRYQVRSVPRGYVPVELVEDSRRVLPEPPKGASPGKSALPAGLVVPGDLQRAGG